MLTGSFLIYADMPFKVDDAEAVAVQLLEHVADRAAVALPGVTFQAHEAAGLLAYRIQHGAEVSALGFQVGAVRFKERLFVAAVFVFIADRAWAAECLDVNVLNTGFFKGFSKRGFGKAGLAARGFLTNVDQHLDPLLSEASHKLIQLPTFVADGVCDRRDGH